MALPKYTPDLDRQFTRLWRQGATFKRISLDMGIGTTTVRHWVHRLGLKQRHEHKGKRDYTLIRVHVSTGIAKAIEDRIFDRYANRSAYVLSLIKRDVGMSD